MGSMTWTTAIAEVGVDDVVIRGHRLRDLTGNATYADMAFLLIRGSMPSAPERAMLDAVLVSLSDHGISPTTIVARTLTSCGTPIQAGMAGAFLSIADWHGGSGEEVGRLLAEVLDDHGAEGAPSEHPGVNTAVRDVLEADALRARCAGIVADHRARRLQIPGFGHPQHTDGDPRAIQLLDLAAYLGVADRYCRALDVFGVELVKATGRPPLKRANITGALAAILMDLGFPWTSIRGIVIAARALGLTAHIVEEVEQGNRWRHAAAEDVEYTGPQPD